MSAADGFLTPPRGAAHAELERRYRRLLRLYPSEFRARRGTEMLGVLMASARDGQTRPTPGDVADVVRESLLMRLRGPRGGWATALAAFALLAPLLLVLTDILLVAVPYWESQAAWENRIRSAKAVVPAGTALPPELLERFHDGGIQLLSQPSFLILAGGHVIVAAAVLAGLRRTALAALLVAAVDTHAVHWNNFNVLALGRLATTLLTYAVFLLVAFALAVADPRAARRLVTWRHAVTVLLLAGAVQAWSFGADASADLSPADAYLVAGFVLAVIALALPVVLGLGWRISLLFATVCPCAVGAAFLHTSWIGSIVSTKWVLYLPPLLVACWSAAWLHYHHSLKSNRFIELGEPGVRGWGIVAGGGFLAGHSCPLPWRSWLAVAVSGPSPRPPPPLRPRRRGSPRRSCAARC
jgi:hypothetical protein